MNANLIIRAHAVVEQLRTLGLSLSLAESCTGGMIASAVTSIPGASSVLQFGWVCYSAQAKHQQLGLNLDLVMEHGVVSKEVADA